MPGIQASIGQFKVSPDLPLDTVFHALDGQDVHIDGDACQVEVYGIYDDGGKRWVQLALAGQRPRMMTLRLGAGPLDVVSKVS